MGRDIDVLNEGMIAAGIRVFVGGLHEWHVDIRKFLPANDMGEKGLSCLDGCGD